MISCLMSNSSALYSFHVSNALYGCKENNGDLLNLFIHASLEIIV